MDAAWSRRRPAFPPGHLSLRPQCGICGCAFVVEQDDIIGLIGSSDSSWLTYYTDPTPFIAYGSRMCHVHRWTLCRKQSCELCRRLPETATVHVECFRNFRIKCAHDQALDRVWRYAAWCKPWRQAPTYSLPNESFVSKESLAVVAKAYSIQQLTEMPPEIVQHIRKYSSTAIFWRLVVSSDVAKHLSSLENNNLVSSSLEQISDWNRGSPPTFSLAPLSSTTIVRLWIDWKGIKMIETFPRGESKYSPKRFDNMLFVIKEPKDLVNITAHYQDGQLRLELAGGLPKLQLWDTPTPPKAPLPGEFISEGSAAASHRFCTINLGTITGLTFTYNNANLLVAIHGHTSAHPYAEIPPESLTVQGKKTACWIYVPLPAPDEIVGISVKTLDTTYPWIKPWFLIQTKLAGEIVVGPWHPGRFQIHKLSSSPKSLMTDRAELSPVAIVGAYPRPYFERSARSRQREIGVVPVNHPSSFPTAEGCCYFSFAPLQDVTSITIFYLNDNDICRGILLEYANGGQRALGECRIGHDRCKRYGNIATLCIQTKAQIRPGSKTRPPVAKVICSETKRHQHEPGEESKCSELKGVLHFWFTPNMSFVEVIQ
ncbi:hypothetical protein S7711_04722 [Stachybotrys chartarum IBT 7711]|uniref:Uncharacterized protein n=1 Tax=Stachybotrys chartarum (strain CBS 109288 / IBT 7711) TaxID=1280523 RepID=A0A084AP12_STACB|nr:hypothetical protein S7711_04722 [Stachybotrys chartarum IBT 7711]